MLYTPSAAPSYLKIVIQRELLQKSEDEKGLIAYERRVDKIADRIVTEEQEREKIKRNRRSIFLTS